MSSELFKNIEFRTLIAQISAHYWYCFASGGIRKLFSEVKDNFLVPPKKQIIRPKQDLYWYQYGQKFELLNSFCFFEVTLMTFVHLCNGIDAVTRSDYFYAIVSSMIEGVTTIFCCGSSCHEIACCFFLPWGHKFYLRSKYAKFARV